VLANAGYDDVGRHCHGENTEVVWGKDMRDNGCKRHVGQAQQQVACDDPESSPPNPGRKRPRIGSSGPFGIGNRAIWWTGPGRHAYPRVSSRGQGPAPARRGQMRAHHARQSSTMIPRSDLPWKPVTRSPSPGMGVTGIPGELAGMAFPLAGASSIRTSLPGVAPTSWSPRVSATVPPCATEPSGRGRIPGVTPQARSRRLACPGG